MPEIASYDFDVTKNEECFESIPYLDAQANDKVYMLLHQFGNLKLMKRSASYGGSEKELVISNGVGYQIKLYEDETDQLEVHETLGASYTIYRVNPENESIPIVRGSITVNPRSGESVPAYRIEQRAMLYVTGSEMPDASKYPEGTVVSKNGALYLQIHGEWEVVGELAVVEGYSGSEPTTYIKAITPVCTIPVMQPAERYVMECDVNILSLKAENSLLLTVMLESTPTTDIQGLPAFKPYAEAGFVRYWGTQSDAAFQKHFNPIVKNLLLSMPARENSILISRDYTKAMRLLCHADEQYSAAGTAMPLDSGFVHKYTYESINVGVLCGYSKYSPYTGALGLAKMTLESGWFEDTENGIKIKLAFYNANNSPSTQKQIRFSLI